MVMMGKNSHFDSIIGSGRHNSI